MLCRSLTDPARADGRLVILTPFDPVYLAMSLLEKLPLRYLAFSELWEAAAAQLGEEDDEMRDDILRFGALHCVKQRVAVICETQCTFTVDTYAYTALMPCSVP